MARKESSIAILPSLDLWSLPPVQISIDKDQCNELRPIATPSSSTPIQFESYIGHNEYLNFNETVLHLRLSVTANHAPNSVKGLAATAMEDSDWKNIVPENYLLHALFKQVDIEIGSKKVASTQDYHLRAYVEGLLAYSTAAKKSYLSAAGWEDDIANRQRSIMPLHSESNKSIGRTVDLCGKLHVDLAQQGRALMGNNTVHVTFLPNDPKVYMRVKGEYDINVKFIDARLLPDVSVVSPRLLTAHQRALSVAKARYPLARREIRRKILHGGTTDAPWDNIVLGHLPKTVFVMFVPNDAYNGHFDKSAFYFSHHNVSHLSLYADGTQYPQNGYNPDYSQKLYAREYYGLYRILEQNNTDPHFTISKEQYLDGNVIYAFRLVPDCSNGVADSGYTEQPRIGNLRLEMKFREPLKEVTTVLMHCTFDDTMEIDEFREVNFVNSA